MRRVAGPLLVGVGVFLLALAVLLPTYVVPRFEKIPLDEYGVSRAAGEGSYLNTETFRMVPSDEITITRVARGDVEASQDAGDDVAMFDYTQTVEPSQMTEPLNVITERVRLDRSTGYGVGGTGDRPDHEDALTIKFPFDVQQTDYLLHDITAGEAYPMSFEGETEVQGLEVYEFRGVVEETDLGDAEVPGTLVGSPARSVFVDALYENDGITVFVEPRTGIVVDATSQPRRSFRPVEFGSQAGGAETTVFEADVRYTEDTVAANVEDAEDARSQLQLVGVTLPIVAGVLGLALIAAGVLLVLRGGRPRRAYGSHAAD